jgi:hypothetical protein
MTAKLMAASVAKNFLRQSLSRAKSISIFLMTPSTSGTGVVIAPDADRGRAQPPVRRHRIEGLSHLGLKQLLRRDRWIKPTAHLTQYLIHHLLDAPDRVLPPYQIIHVDQTDELLLLFNMSSHAFLQKHLPCALNGVFQQPAKGSFHVKALSVLVMI